MNELKFDNTLRKMMEVNKPDCTESNLIYCNINIEEKEPNGSQQKGLYLEHDRR